MAWILEGSEPILETRWLTVKRNSYLLPSGKRVRDYYVVERASFVLVVARTGGSLMMVRQYRPATEQEYFSLPAGYIDEGESPEDAAARELKEETGLKGELFRVIGRLDPLPGYLRSPAFVVVCTVPAERPVIQDREEIEDAQAIPVGAVLRMIRSGEINEMQAVSAILLAQLYDPASGGAVNREL